MKRTLLSASLAVFTAILTSSCTQPRGGSSDGCDGGTNWGGEPVYLNITKINGNPVTTIDIPLNRLSGSTVSASFDISTQIGTGWCGSSYSGSLTYDLENLVAGVSRVFDPAMLPASNSYQARSSVLTLTILPSVSDGPIPLKFVAKEGKVSSAQYRIILTTTP